jgi:hypothetical protein
MGWALSPELLVIQIMSRNLDAPSASLGHRGCGGFRLARDTMMSSWHARSSINTQDYRVWHSK